MKLRHIAAFAGMLLTALMGGMGKALTETATPLDWAAIPLPSLDGGQIPPDSLKGKVVLVVNTASLCGFTPQYEGLEALWERYRDRGLVVLGVPSNDFGGQEPGTAAEIQRFCTGSYGVDFPMLTKQVVVGPEAHPFYLWAASQTGPAGVPKWNFHKILVGRDGRLLSWFGSMVTPEGDKLTGAIEAALAEPGS